MADQWYVAEGGQGYGPFSLGQLRQMMAIGLVKSDDLVWEDGAVASTYAADLLISPAASKPSRHYRLAFIFSMVVTLGLLAGWAWAVASNRPDSGEMPADQLAQEQPQSLANISSFDPASIEPSETSQPDPHDPVVTETAAGESSVAGTASNETSPASNQPTLVPTAATEEPAPSSGISDAPEAGSDSTGSSSTELADDLLPLVDVTRDVVQGRWSRDGDALRCDSGGGTLALPVDLPKHFDLLVQVKRLEGRTAFSIGIVRDDISGLVILDNWEGSGLENIDGKRRRDNGTYIKRKHFQIGQESEVILRIDGESVFCTIDGEPVIDWRGSYHRLSQSGNQRSTGAPHGKICLYSDSGSVHEISRVELRPLNAE